MRLEVVALLMILGFYAVAFGLRTYQHLRQTGSTGFHGLSGRPGSVEWWGGALFVLGVVLSLVAPIAGLLGWVASPEVGPGQFILGGGAVLVGIAATYAAQTAMGRSWRIGVRGEERTELVTAGPFALVRNPIFSCMLFTAAALVVVLPNAVALASFACLLLAVELQVRWVEEPYLLRVHGGKYRSYAGRVGRFVPGLGLLRG
ncbi:methyltransferase family protein [Nannocystis bainbridge]|uniref:Isoprenylcysteine carboxylmethyltransferase family protein n=1 Tax=Nannocystis bainbridge TaxID=2995303 RepID=A0ABT5E6T8_9BACT|nr:isoprenylcysteine carboxylmethyltransferase family protein [Nannocystis bainbridge]MDC0720633.1 isoprenylcysteine carboxylmethyltransferase family protein [Nannocystis bainbridge]